MNLPDFINPTTRLALTSTPSLKNKRAGGPMIPKRDINSLSNSSFLVTSALILTKLEVALTTSASENVNFSISMQETHQSA